MVLFRQPLPVNTKSMIGLTAFLSDGIRSCGGCRTEHRRFRGTEMTFVPVRRSDRRAARGGLDRALFPSWVASFVIRRRIRLSWYSKWAERIIPLKAWCIDSPIGVDGCLGVLAKSTSTRLSAVV